MQTKREQKQTRMMLLPPLEAFVPKDNTIRVLIISCIRAIRGLSSQNSGTIYRTAYKMHLATTYGNSICAM